MKKLLLATMAGLLISFTANAGVIIISDPVVSMNGANDYTWSYDVFLGPNSTLNPPGTPCTAIVAGGICDGLVTIYDFAGYIGGSIGTTAVDWTGGSVQALGITPLGIIPSDDGGLLNLSWAYVGNSSVQAAPTSAQLLGTFFARSTFDQQTVDDYAGRTSTASGQRSANLDVTKTPIPGQSTVPEPASVFLFGTALLAFAYTSRRRRSL